MAQTSGTYNWQPSAADFIIQAFRRVQIRPPQLTIEHLASARFIANDILTDWSANRGVNLAQVDQLNLALLQGQMSYVLPGNTIELLDVYLRSFTASTSSVNIGNALTAIGPDGNPLVASPQGDPALVAPSSGTLSATLGSSLITLAWPSHGRSVGDPLFWGCPISVGGLNISGFSVVSKVIDPSTLQFYAPTPALENQTLEGGTRLFFSNSGSANIGCIIPSHGLSVGSSFTIGNTPVVVGGLTLPAGASYTVLSVQSLYQFTFNPGLGNASTTQNVFENGGHLNIATQASNVIYTDVPLFPLSRNDYAALPYKLQPGRPTSYWFDRVVPPVLSLYPVADNTGPWGFLAYRLREIQDANPVGGQVPDLPKRMFRAFTAALTADLAEIWAPAMWTAKKAEAAEAWERASAADTETVSTYIVPMTSVYFR